MELPQEAIANKLANDRIKEGAKTALYKVKIIDFPDTKKFKTYVLVKPHVLSTHTLDFQGYEEIEQTTKTSKTKNKQQITHQAQAHEYAKTEKINVVSLQIPWHRVLEIINTNYQLK